MRSLALVADLNGATLAGVVGVAGANADLEDTSVSGEIGSGDDVHWFAVELAADVLYQILVEGPEFEWGNAVGSVTGGHLRRRRRPDRRHER